jgi:hypothetical protein
MITTSDIIVKLIYEAGYKSTNDFAIKNNFKRVSFLASVRKNSWTRPMLDKVGKVLGKDLSKLVTATIGIEKGTRIKFE